MVFENYAYRVQSGMAGKIGIFSLRDEEYVKHMDLEDRSRYLKKFLNKVSRRVVSEKRRRERAASNLGMINVLDIYARPSDFEIEVDDSEILEALINAHHDVMDETRDYGKSRGFMARAAAKIGVVAGVSALGANYVLGAAQNLPQSFRTTGTILSVALSSVACGVWYLQEKTYQREMHDAVYGIRLNGNFFPSRPKPYSN